MTSGISIIYFSFRPAPSQRPGNKDPSSFMHIAGQWAPAIEFYSPAIYRCRFHRRVKSSGNKCTRPVFIRSLQCLFPGTDDTTRQKYWPPSMHQPAARVVQLDTSSTSLATVSGYIGFNFTQSAPEETNWVKPGFRSKHRKQVLKVCGCFPLH